MRRLLLHDRRLQLGDVAAKPRGSALGEGTRAVGLSLLRRQLRHEGLLDVHRLELAPLARRRQLRQHLLAVEGVLAQQRPLGAGARALGAGVGAGAVALRGQLVTRLLERVDGEPEGRARALRRGEAELGRLRPLGVCAALLERGLRLRLRLGGGGGGAARGEVCHVELLCESGGFLGETKLGLRRGGKGGAVAVAGVYVCGVG